MEFHYFVVVLLGRVVWLLVDNVNFLDFLWIFGNLLGCSRDWLIKYLIDLLIFVLLIGWFKNQLIGWSKNRLIGWFKNWLIGWFKNRLIGWFKNGLIGWFKNGLIGWFKNWLFGKFKNRIIGWLIEWKICLLIN